MSKDALMERKVEYLVDGETVKLSGKIVKDYLTRGNADVTDQEVGLFINLCKFQKLNPFLNEAYLVKFGSKPAQNIVAKEAYMKRAESHPQYDGIRAGLILERNGKIIEVEGSFITKADTLLGGWAEVHRKDRKLPTIARVSLDEYHKDQSTWKTMQKTMIRKVAIVQAMREAFPKELGAMYTEDEINTVHRSVEEEVEQEVEQEANAVEVDFTEVVEEPEAQPPVNEPEEQIKADF